MSSLIDSATKLTVALDCASGHEHHWSKTIRRTLNKYNGTGIELADKLRGFIDHDEGLLDSIDNELIQRCYASNNSEHENDRIQMCIALINAKTAFVKNVIQVAAE